MRFLVAATLLALTAACTAEPPIRYEAPPAEIEERMSIAYEAVSVREVSLPIYAATEQIFREDVPGRVTTDAVSLWADDPVRAVTLDIARALRQITGARVAPDPWPYRSRPEVVVDVRFEDLVPGADGTYRAAGLYFVAPEDEDGAEHAHGFDISVPYDPAGGLTALAAARSQLIGLIALDIVESALR